MRNTVLPFENIDLVNECLLPPQMRELVKVIGLAETIVLLKEKGGQPFRFPLSCNSENNLKTILKPNSIRLLCNSEFSGQRIDMPKCDKIINQIRNLYILSQRYKKTKTVLAKEFDLTTRSIQLIWNCETEENPTLDMFNQPVGR